MNCTTASLSGLTLNCETSKGGLRKVLIAVYNDDVAAAVASAATSGDSVDASGVTASGVTWYGYDFRRGSASLTSTLNVDQANGTNYVSSEIVLNFGRMEAKKRAEMKALSLNDVMVIAQDMNGKIWFLGANAPVNASAGTGQTGAAISDANMYQITLQANDDSYPVEVTGLPTYTQPSA